MKTLDWAIERLSENSTWRGIILLITSLGVTLEPEQSEKIIAAGLALIGAINVFRKAPPSAVKVADAINTGSTEGLVETKPIVTASKLPLLFLALAIGLSGCVTGARLETGGPYAATPTQAAMPELFVLDSSFDVAYTALDTVFKYEKNNRAALWLVSHEIKHSLDKLRLEANRVVLDYSLARTVYLSAPTPANLDPLANALSKIQTLNSAALAVISSKGNI